MLHGDLVIDPEDIVGPHAYRPKPCDTVGCSPIPDPSARMTP